MKKRPSSIDVARLAEVSQATVSYVLSNRTDKAISEATREKVLKAAEQLGYLPNRLADGILRGKTSTVGVLMPDFAHTFTSNLLQGLEERLAENGYRILIAHNRNDVVYERHQLRMLMEHRVDGVIVVTDEDTVHELAATIRTVQPSGVAVVVVDDLAAEGLADTVVSDDVQGARAAVEHLISLGHRRIAYLGGGDRASTSRDRRAGYEAALKDAGIQVAPDLILGKQYRTNEDPDLRPLMALKQPPTAIFSASDGLLSQGLGSLTSLGMRVPEDLSVVGYGNLEFARYLGLSTVDQHPREMGHIAAGRMISRLNGDSSPPTTDKPAPTLILRASAGNPPKN
jgi:LacI family transcriptional regulator